MRFLFPLLLPLMVSTAFAQTPCAFDGWDLYALKNSTEFSVGPEKTARITHDLYWANEDFFRDFRHAGCRGAWRTATVTDNRDGEIYRYYRSVEDNCDGGNTNGVFLKEDGSLRAIAIMNDSDIRCRPSTRTAYSCTQSVNSPRVFWQPPPKIPESYL
ncbi:MAG: hypothetical protein KF767_16765 [Bdellovibrionaceae bacterium]|nr:hypothetical protein [Pseudobdellovibrionaceae bacterium]